MEAAMDLNVPYGFTRRLAGVSLADARARITEALKREGFGVLTEIDVQATLKKKLDVDTDPYVILGACNPQLAQQALAREPGVGLLLPCNVVVAQDRADALISAASPRAMFSVVQDKASLEPIAADAEQRLRRAIEAA
jgi:uncharacterized protein (DUF302 family)